MTRFCINVENMLEQTLLDINKDTSLIYLIFINIKI